jgi:hypothetical protein
LHLQLLKASKFFVKLKISQTSTSGAPKLVEEVGNESVELDETNGQLDDEVVQLVEPYKEL